MTDPVDFLLRAAMRLPRPAIERLTEALIAGLDALDGDPDVELNGDELDGSMGEDDFHDQNANWRGEPGCPVADPDHGRGELPLPRRRRP